jgi:DNA (cytosine-5)-methyltransferase 1
VKRYVIDSPRPFIVGLGGRMGQSPERGIERPFQTITSKADSAIVVPSLIQIQNASASDAPMSIEAPMRTVTAYPKGGGFALAAPLLVPRYGEREGQAPRAARIDAPMPTIVPTQNGGQLVAAFMAQHNTDVIGHAMTEPVSTIVGKGCTQALVTGDLFPTDVPTWPGRAAEVAAFIVAYFGNERDGADLFSPMRTVTARERFALVTVNGTDYVIADIGMRMLAARELYRAQGFPDTYRIDVEFNGKPLTKTAQVRMCGNSVVPALARALVLANVGTPAQEVAA